MIPILWAGLLAIAAAVGGAWVGWDYRDGKVAQDVLTAVKATTAEHNENVGIDMQAAYEAGARANAARTNANKLGGEANAANTANPYEPKCGLDPVRRGVLDRAIDAANTDTDPGNGVPDPMRKAPVPGK